MARKTIAEDRQDALQQLFSVLDKTCGPGTGRPIPEQKIEQLPRIPSSLLSVNYVTGGGLPLGRIVEFFGSESGGKTSLAIDFMAQAQRANLRVAYIDAEHSFDPSWATTLGADINTMLYHAPDTGEEALEVTSHMVKSGVVSLIVVDSVSALVPLAEVKGDMGEAHMGLQARLMSQGLRKLAPLAANSQCCILFINQLREKIGQSYGNPETTSGGRALRFWSSIRLDVRRGDYIEVKEQRIGNQVRITAQKNKTAPPFRKTLIPLMYYRGFDVIGELFDLGLEAEIITRAGAWYSFGEDKLGLGREASLKSLEDATRRELLTQAVSSHLMGDRGV